MRLRLLHLFVESRPSSVTFKEGIDLSDSKEQNIKVIKVIEVIEVIKVIKVIKSE